jgi:hypothetical protein
VSADGGEGDEEDQGGGRDGGGPAKGGAERHGRYLRLTFIHG